MAFNQRVPSISLAVLLMLSAVTVMGLNNVPYASATFPGVNGRIYFDGNADNGSPNEIYSMNPDGSGLIRLTDNPADDSTPRLSPDGTKIAFTSDRSGSSEIYVLKADGSGQTRLTTLPGGSSYPTWSPDGSKIAFSHNGNIYVMNADGSLPKNLTNDAVFGANYPDWSPDGSKIAFSGNGGIYVINADGSGLRGVGQEGGNPSWSPDGKKMVFSKEVDTFDFGIYTINSDGTNLTSLLNPPRGYVASPKWSPDGTKIVFQSGLTVANTLIMNPDGSGKTKITPQGFPEFSRASPSMWAVQSTSPVPPPNQHPSLTVNSVDLAGKSVTGVWTTVRGMDGSLLKSGYTPLTFTGDFGTYYKVTVANFDGKIFQHWQDDNSSVSASNNSTIEIDLTTNTTLTAKYDTGDSLRGFSPLTFIGTTMQPDLTIDAISLDGSNKTLHMWMIIDPQSTNSSGTTYKVYASKGYQNLSFDHWGDNGSEERIRTITIRENTTITAYYNSPVAGGAEKIALSSNRDGNFEIYTMNIDGSEQKRLTLIPDANNTNPTWSPDGKKILFTSSKGDGGSQIYAMNGDGSGPVNLSNNSTAMDSSPSWSQDGKKVAFVRGGDKRVECTFTSGQIYVMDSSGGGNKTKIGDGSCPSWLPNGSKVGFVSTEPGQPGYQIKIANADGSGVPTQIPAGPYRIGNPTWSPDGTKIANELDQTFRFPRIMIEVRSANGTSIGQIPFTPSSLGTDFGIDARPEWSSDGNRLAFSTSTFIVHPTPENHIPQGGIFTAEAGNLTQVTRLTDNYTDNSHIWSPDGRKIVFRSERDGNAEIYRINADGTGLTRLTNNIAADIDPDWSRPASSSSSAQQARLSVSTVGLSGKAVEGVWTTIHGIDGTLLQTGFTPLTFTGDAGTSYKVTMANYDGKVFQHWNDTGDDSMSRTVALKSNMTIAAVYTVPEVMRFTPFDMHLGPSGGPDVKVNATTTEGGDRILKMWMLLHLVGRDARGVWTAQVYATDSYQNLKFDHWENGSADRFRTVTSEKPNSITAYYKAS